MNRPTYLIDMWQQVRSAGSRAGGEWTARPDLQDVRFSVDCHSGSRCHSRRLPYRQARPRAISRDDHLLSCCGHGRQEGHLSAKVRGRSGKGDGGCPEICPWSQYEVATRNLGMMDGRWRMKRATVFGHYSDEGRYVRCFSFIGFSLSIFKYLDVRMLGIKWCEQDYMNRS